MSGPTGKELCYFSLPRDQKESSEGSETVSPLTVPNSSPHVRSRPQSRRPILLEEHRSRSDASLLRMRPRVQDIDEETSSLELKSPVFDREGDDQNHIVKLDRPKTSRSSSRLSPKQLVIQTLTKETRGNVPLCETPSKREDTGQRAFWDWKQSRAEDFLNESPGGQLRSFISIKSETPIESVHVPHVQMQPLRPPLKRTDLTRPHSNRHIKIEKSFTTIEPETANKEASEQAPQKSRRTSSINPKHIFSSSVKIFRRNLRSASNVHSRPTELRSTRSKDFSRDHSDHQTNLRKGVAAAGLKRVSYILGDVKSLSARGRTLSDKTVSTSTSRSWGSQRNHANSTNIRPLERARSMELQGLDTNSPSSSLRRLQMGVTPNNTPEEKATYTVVDKNGLLTEYLKLDISIRGRTSYLPSEARRIHTPPLPSQGLDGKTRGFFFDYKTPEISKKQTTSTIENSPKGQSQGAFRMRESCSSNVSEVPTISHQCVPRGLNNDARAGDWYGRKLAELDSLSGHEESINSPYFEISDTKLCSPSDEELDHGIPEHLPTSVLCPRHPRYWRIVKSKGSKFRGC